jgi:hypothetical protein
MTEARHLIMDLSGSATFLSPVSSRAALSARQCGCYPHDTEPPLASANGRSAAGAVKLSLTDDNPYEVER